MASPEIELERYLGLWIGVAVVSLLVVGGELVWRNRVAGTGLSRQMTWLAVGQFLPSLVVGGLLTLCIYRGRPKLLGCCQDYGRWFSRLAFSLPTGCCLPKCCISAGIMWSVGVVV